MDFLKKNYEKIILSIVLAGVAVAAFLLLIEVNQVKDALETNLTQISRQKQDALKPVDLTTNELALKRVTEGSFHLQLDGVHNTFNPGTWEKTPDGLKRRTGKGGLGGVTVARMLPLNLVIAYTGVASVAETPRYQFTITKEYEKQPAKRRPVIGSLSVLSKNDVMILKEAKGPKEDPTELVGELVETGERFVVSKTAVFRKPVSYAVDLRNDNKDIPTKRVDESFTVSGVTYKIVAIGKDEIVVSAPNQVRTTIPAIAVP